MNKIEKKIEEIIKKAIDDNANIVPFTEAATKNLSTLFTEMVEGELGGLEKFIDGLKLPTDVKELHPSFVAGRNSGLEELEQYLLERKIEN